jgi:hypothetical protein
MELEQLTPITYVKRDAVMRILMPAIFRDAIKAREELEDWG